MIDAITERFLRYVRIDTQSDPASGSTPSSKNQFLLGEILVKELIGMGLNDVKQDEFSYVIAKIPENTDKKVPTILFCSHLDTSPDCAASGVNPIVHENYQGGDITLMGDATRVIRTKDFPELLHKIGMDIITSDGSTLLGADNKAGLSELMEVNQHLNDNPEIKHGKLVFLFVPDEEIARDTQKLKIKELGADYGYTVDGHTLGSVNNETFSIGKVVLEINGNSTHTGSENGMMENALRIASEVISNIPRSVCSELSRGRKGFIHIAAIEGKMSFTKLTFQLRAFGERELKDLAEIIRTTSENVFKNFSRSSFSFTFEITERNIIETLKDYPFITDFAIEAIKRAGLEPRAEPLRGATTGTGLCALGLPTANLFTGQHGNHSKYEWVCIQDMQKSVECILNLIRVWEEKGSDVGKRN